MHQFSDGWCVLGTFALWYQCGNYRALVATLGSVRSITGYGFYPSCCMSGRALSGRGRIRLSSVGQQCVSFLLLLSRLACPVRWTNASGVRSDCVYSIKRVQFTVSQMGGTMFHFGACGPHSSGAAMWLRHGWIVWHASPR